MFSKKVVQASKNKPRNNEFANMMGLGIPIYDDDNGDGNDDEDSLLAELAALEGKSAASKKKKPPPKKALMSMGEINNLAAFAARGVESENEDEDDDIDENDLLAELNELTEDNEEQEEDPKDTKSVKVLNGIGQLLSERKQMYTTALSNAKEEGASSKIRRLERGLKDIEVMIKKVTSGAAINEDEIPPPVALGISASKGLQAAGPPLQAAGPPIQAAGPPLQAAGPLLQAAGSPLQAAGPPLQAAGPPLQAAGSPLQAAGPPLQAAGPPLQAAGPPLQAAGPPLQAAGPPLQAAGPPLQAAGPPQSFIDSSVVPPPIVSNKCKEETLLHLEKNPSLQPSLQTVKTDLQLPSMNQKLPESFSSLEYSKQTLETLLARQKEFKIEALKSKQCGDMQSARNYLTISKKFDIVIEALKSGKEVDLTNIPELPGTINSILSNTQIQESRQTSTLVTSSSEAATEPKTVSEPYPPTPVTIMDALLQRLEKYQSSVKSAEEENNSGKARRMGRIVKQYEDAIKNYKLNKPVDYNELPVPPGFGPIPGVAAPPEETELPSELPIQQSITSPTNQASLSEVAPSSRNRKEYEFVVNRQKEFKMAALQAKKEGDMDSAREYLRQAKGLDQMVVAAQNGLRVDVTTVPQLKCKSVTQTEAPVNAVPKESALISGSTEDKYKIIENALRKQIEASEKNAEHYKLLGNLDAAKNFESLLKSSKKDLETLLQYKAQGSPVPSCEYQMQTFPIVRSNPQLSDSELEITIVRCINVPMPAGWQPKDMHIYVTFEFPIPKEKPQTGCTTTKKDTINPEFNESFKVSIDRKNQSFVRQCKRQVLTVKVNHVRGFLKADRAIGQGFVKLERFSNRCEIHESVDLMDVEKGRKSVGGKIEILLKIREPFVDKDAEIVTEKWLVLDTHLRGLMMNMPNSTPQPKTTSTSYDSLEVLQYEKNLLETQIAAYKAQGKAPPVSLPSKIQQYQQKMQEISTRLKSGGRTAIDDYLQNLIRAMENENIKATQALKKNDKDTAKTCLSKKKLLEKEVGAIKQRVGIT